MLDDIALLASALRTASHYEDAAALLLRRLLRIAGDHLAGSRFAKQGRVLRAVLHLRPNGAYSRLFMLGFEAARAEEAEIVDRTGEMGPGAFWISATAWRAMVEHRAPASLDVNLGVMSVHEGRAEPGGTPALRRVPVKSQESTQRYLGRQASHVQIVPIFAVGGAVEGMVSIEADCLSAVGQELIGPECTEELQVLVDVAAPHVIGLPQRPGAAAQPDELLPVIGGAMTAMVPILTVFARQEETILLSGPTGAGKSRLARWCHARSPRSEKRFDVLDLNSVPEELQLAELFGWRKGAFTSAVRDNTGAVARAEGGTLFLDEIDKLSLKAQAGLLHVLEERTYSVLGDGHEERRADVRFLVGTNADLAAAVQAGRFREDLYYRINVLPVRVPPLSERRDEIPLWAAYLLSRRHAERGRRGGARLSPEAQQRLLATPWPGNLRQLDNIVRRAYALAIVAQGDEVPDVVLDEASVAKALAYEKLPDSSSLTRAMHAAASEFVRKARASAAGVDLDLADALRGFVLGTAIQELGRDEAFRVVGRESVLKGRNHHKLLRRELDKVSALLRAVGEQAQPFAELGDGDDADKA